MAFWKASPWLVRLTFQRASQGQSQVVILMGEAGIGKTRLAREFLQWAKAQGAEILQGRAFETGGELPYQPLAHLLGHLLEQEQAPAELLSLTWLAELSRLLPELRDRYPDLSHPLTIEETLALVASLEVGEDLSPPIDLSPPKFKAFAQTLFTETGGQPLYLVETIKTLLEQKVLIPYYTADGVQRLQWQTLSGETTGHFPLPRLIPLAFVRRFWTGSPG